MQVEFRGWFPEPEGVLETLCPSGVPFLWVCLADDPGVVVNTPITPPPAGGLPASHFSPPLVVF